MERRLVCWAVLNVLLESITSVESTIAADGIVNSTISRHRAFSVGENACLAKVVGDIEASASLSESISSRSTERGASLRRIRSLYRVYVHI